MALDATKFEKTSGGRCQLFAYDTTDAIATVTGSGYFNTMTTSLRQFDRISVVGLTGGTPTLDWIFVTSATGATTVTTSALEGVTAS